MGWRGCGEKDGETWDGKSGILTQWEGEGDETEATKGTKEPVRTFTQLAPSRKSMGVGITSVSTFNENPEACCGMRRWTSVTSLNNNPASKI